MSTISVITDAGTGLPVTASSIPSQEPVAFAVRIGMKAKWFQPEGLPHFDLTVYGRDLVIEQGAIALDQRAFVAKLLEIRRSASVRRVE